MSLSAISSAHMGMTRATDRLEHSASRIARMTMPGADIDIASELTNVMTAKTEFKANVKVAEAANQMTKSLLDIFV